MRRTKKLILFSAGCLAAGAILAGTGSALGGSPANIWFDNSGLQIVPSGEKAATVSESLQILEKTPLEAFDHVDLDIAHADLMVIPSDGFYLEYQLSDRREVSEWKVSHGQFEFHSGRYSENSANQINISLFAIDTNEGDYEEYVKLYVPEDAIFDNWEIKAAHGDVSIKGIQAGDCTMDLQYSNLLFEQSAMTSLNLQQRHSDMALRELETEQMILSAWYSDITMRQISAPEFRLEEGRHGSLTAEDIRSVRFSSDSEYVNLDLTRFQTEQIAMKAKHGSILLDLQNCSNIVVNHTYTDLELTTDKSMAVYQTDISLEFGEISIDDVEYGDRFTSGSSADGKIAIKGRHGDVDIKTSH